MIVTGANKFVSRIHDRMPVILEPGDFDQWERGSVQRRDRADEARER
jgi:putative SOS response-associated peptidase YedK